jgi:hypothetical protein
MADGIQARTIRHAVDLPKEIESARGVRGDLEPRGGRRFEFDRTAEAADRAHRWRTH